MLVLVKIMWIVFCVVSQRAPMMLRGSSVARLAAFGRGGALQSQARKIHSKPPNAAYTLVLIR